MDLIEYWKAEKQKLLEQNASYADKADAEGRGLTEEERTKVSANYGEVAELDTKIADEGDKRRVREMNDKFMKGYTDGEYRSGGISVPVPRDVQAINQRGSMGDVFIQSEAFKSLQARVHGGERPPEGYKIEVPVDTDVVRYKAAGDPVLESANTAWFGNGSTTAGALTDIQPTAAPLVRRLTLADVIPTIPVTANTVTVPTVTTRVAISGTAQTEGSAKPGGNYVFGTSVAVVKTYAGWIKVSEQFLDDAPGLAAYINQDLPYQVLFNEEAAIATALYADAGLHVNGSGLTGALASATGYDAVAEAIAEIAINGGEADTLVISPDDWGYLVTLKFGSGATTSGYVGNGPFNASNNPWGLRTVVTPAATSGLPLVLDAGRAGKIYRRSGLTVRSTNTDQDDFVKNLVTILAESRMVYKTLYTYLIAVCAIGSS